MKYILLSILVLTTGCTTIGQQITNKNGTVEVHQTSTPVSAETVKPKANINKTTNNVTGVKLPDPEQEILVEVTETLISRNYIL